MTDLKPGDMLTYEQVMALPDGAVWSAVWDEEKNPHIFTGPPQELMIDSMGEHNYHTDNIRGWDDYLWHSARLVSLPKDNQEIIPEKLSQSATEQATAPTVKDSLIAKRAAESLLYKLIRTQDDPVNGSYEGLYNWCHQYIEAYDYAKSIGAI